jgi:hypothetical protein
VCEENAGTINGPLGTGSSMTKPRQFENAEVIQGCTCHQGSVCGPACADHHHEECPLDPNYILTKSERAIEREIEKREEEARIAASLISYQRQEVKERSSESTFLGLGWHMRKPKLVKSGWKCPVGCASN